MAAAMFGSRSQAQDDGGGLTSLGLGAVQTSLKAFDRSGQLNGALRSGMHPIGPASNCVTIVAIAGGTHSGAVVGPPDTERRNLRALFGGR